jgi:hypothetical protein
MNKRGRVRLIVVISTGLLARSAFAQTTNENEASSSAQVYGAQPVVSSGGLIQPPGGSSEQQTQYAPALDGSGLISMDSNWKAHMLLGATAGGGWDSSPDNQGTGVSTGVYTLSPYFGVRANTSKIQYLLQYQPTITRYSSSSYSNQTMHVASAKIVGNVNGRWDWDFRATGSHGDDSIRLLAPQQTVAVGEVPGTGPNSASYLPNAGTVTYIDGGLGVHYKRTERSSFEFDIANTFNHNTGFGQDNSIATASIDYDRGLSPTLGMLVYEQSSYYYGSIKCASFGAGVGIMWQLREKASLSLRGGPQFDTSACGDQQGFSYAAAFSTRLTGKSQVYLLAARQPTTSYLGPGLWQTSTSGGYQRQVAAKGTLSFDVGYVGSNTLTTVDSYHGAYLGGNYSHRIGYGLSASLSYRGYIGDTGGTRYNRNIALFALSWTPVAWMPIVGHLFQ